MSAPAPNFARVLEAGRSAFNARVAQARSRSARFDTAALSDFLRDRVAPLVEAVAATAPDAVGTTTVAAFDAALSLVGQGLAGPERRGGLLDRAWAELLPALPRAVADAPAALIVSLCNAAIHLDRAPAARGREWIASMTALGARAGSLGELLGLGQVLAWTAGLAHYRHGALQALDRLNPDLGLAAFGAPAGSDWAALRARLREERWWSPDPVAAQRAVGGFRVGAFTGFGGAFSEPPKVRAAPGGFVLRSGERCFALHLDVYGWSLLPAAAADFESGTRDRPAPYAPPASVVHGALRIGGSTWALDLPQDGLDVAASEDSVAVSSIYSHALVVRPRRMPAR